IKLSCHVLVCPAKPIAATVCAMYAQRSSQSIAKLSLVQTVLFGEDFNAVEQTTGPGNSECCPGRISWRQAAFDGNLNPFGGMQDEYAPEPGRQRFVP